MQAQISADFRSAYCPTPVGCVIYAVQKPTTGTLAEELNNTTPTSFYFTAVRGHGLASAGLYLHACAVQRYKSMPWHLGWCSPFIGMVLDRALPNPGLEHAAMSSVPFKCPLCAVDLSTPDACRAERSSQAGFCQANCRRSLDQCVHPVHSSHHPASASTSASLAGSRPGVHGGEQRLGAPGSSIM